MREKIVSFLALFGSSATLLCCALPALLVVLAGGAAMGALLSTFPWLVPLSSNKEWIFLGAGLLLLFNGILTLRPKGKVACAITGGKGCEVAGNFTKGMFWFSILLYGIGGFVAFALVPILRFFDV